MNTSTEIKTKELSTSKILQAINDTCKEFTSESNLSIRYIGKSPIQFGIIYNINDIDSKNDFIKSLIKEVKSRPRFFCNEEKIVKSYIIESKQLFQFNENTLLVIDHDKIKKSVNIIDELSEIQFKLRGISETNKLKKLYLIHLFPSDGYKVKIDTSYNDFSINCDFIFELNNFYA